MIQVLFICQNKLSAGQADIDASAEAEAEAEAEAPECDGAEADAPEAASGDSQT